MPSTARHLRLNIGGLGTIQPRPFALFLLIANTKIMATSDAGVSALAGLVSAIVPVYNGERYLSEALDSALAQTYQNIEIIVVDDGSTDSSARIAENYAATHPQRVRLIRQANGGTGSARNAAMAEARGDYIAMLDQDDLWAPRHLEEAVAVLENEPSIGLVHANIQVLDGVLHPTSPPPWRQADDVFVRLLLRRAHIPCLTVVFRRSLVERVGGFDPAFFKLGNDDRDMWLRISRVAGVRHLESLHGAWRRHGGNQSRDKKKLQAGQFLLVDRHAVGPHRHLRARARAAIHAEMGYDLLHSDGVRWRALVAYIKAIYRYPFFLGAWKGLANSLFASPPRSRAT
ncbi:MAG: glycosyltransferase family 2 protein [Rhodanobacteraceae bacterium]